MIRRKDPGGLLLITQDHHASVAGEIARHWGNDRFPAPSPHEVVTEAIACHDAGWSLHDGRPILNEEHLPAAFYEIPVEAFVRIWVASVSAVVARSGPLAGLIVSWHFTALAKQIPLEEQPEPVQHLLTDFIVSQQARRADYCNALGLTKSMADEPPKPVNGQDHDATYNLDVLRACDWLSLRACAGELPDFLMEASKTLLPGDHPAVTTSWLDPHTLVVRPWPLNVECLSIKVPARAVPDGRYRRNADLERVYDAAETVELSLEIKRK